MIFITGSVLIVGKCEEDVLNKIYDFIKNILESEYQNIKSINNMENDTITKTRKRKIRKKYLLFDTT